MKRYYREPAGETFPKLEEEILSYWRSREVPRKVIERMASGRPFVFCEGPPTTRNRPHMGNAFTRAVKDANLRFGVMNGSNIVPYIAGWDCHGLPVEIEVEKELKLESKADIESYGVERFNTLCRERVVRFKSEWEDMSRRIGYWLNYDDAYLTMSNEYIESVWWAFKQLHSKGLLTRDRQVSAYCYRCGTTLGSHEVALGFHETEDRSVIVRFKMKDMNASILSHTTSPWTLVANTFLAVRKDWEYAIAEIKGERLIVGVAHAARLLPEARIIETFAGESLLGKHYEPVFDFPGRDGNAFRIVHSSEVPESEGTGVVQISPAYAAVDYGIAMEMGSEVFDPVDDAGKFTDAFPELQGHLAGESDAEIIRLLESSGRLFKWELIRHSYPFCWRCNTPLIYKPKDAWIVSAADARDTMREMNEQVHWVPESYKDGRFGNFIADAKDWVVSRARYWGTPLPIWRCQSGHELCIGSTDELERHAIGEIPDDLDLHRPFVDSIRLRCPECNSPMMREEFVLDCWFDSGCAPFAQYHYPFENMKEFDVHRAVDFISESADQTRGWFYTQHVLATLLFDSPAFKSVLVMGQVYDKDGRKIEAEGEAVVNPEDIFSSVGADASRLYLLGSPVWDEVEFSEENVRQSMVRTLATLLNVYSFFASNSNRLRYRGEVLPRKTHDLDVWILSRLNTTVMESRLAFEALEVHRTVRAVVSFVDDLSNWHLRRSRKRFLQDSDPEDRFSAYSTLHECLMTICKVMAPITPFLAEYLYRSLQGPLDSVHLEEYPIANRGAVNRILESQMSLVRRTVEAGRLARQKAGIKLRQPLEEAIIAAGEDGMWVLRRYERMIADELNVKRVECIESRESMIEYALAPNLKSLGPRLKESAADVAALMEKVDGGQMARHLASSGRIRIGGFDIFEEDVIVSEKEKAGYSHAAVGSTHVYVSTSLRPKLKLEGLSREFVRRIQQMRKDLSLEFGEPIEVEYSAHPDIENAITAYESKVKQAINASSLSRKPSIEDGKSWTINKMPLRVSIRKP
ncbi:MAG: isoleucine--tRNA ligase [Methanobacteriota archaeon]|nr:MAG: isoleucine--tRNA ligase [Euryarchaeota archaeon]